MNAKLLPILSLVAAAFAALGAGLVSGPFFWILCTALAASLAVLLFLAGDLVGRVAGGILAAACLISLFTIEPIGGENWDLSSLHSGLGPAWNVSLLAMGVGGLVAVRWNSLPQWAAIGGAVAAVAAIVALFLTPHLGSAFGSSIPAVLICLLLAVPGVMALRAQ